MIDGNDEVFELGWRGEAGMSDFYLPEPWIPRDTIDNIKESIESIDSLIDTLGKDDSDPYYDNEMSFRGVLLNIKTILERKVSYIEETTELCDSILSDLRETCYYQAFTYPFLVKYRDLMRDV